MSTIAASSIVVVVLFWIVSILLVVENGIRPGYAATGAVVLPVIAYGIFRWVTGSIECLVLGKNAFANCSLGISRSVMLNIRNLLRVRLKVSLTLRASRNVQQLRNAGLSDTVESP